MMHFLKRIFKNRIFDFKLEKQICYTSTRILMRLVGFTVTVGDNSDNSDDDKHTNTINIRHITKSREL